MGGVDVGSGEGKRRATNSEINMIPFIDLLMVTIAFLLITAVWVTSSRINADAQVPGPSGCGADCPPITDRVMHLHVGESEFGLTWKQGSTVISEVKIPKEAVVYGDGSASAVRYPKLAERIETEWTSQGVHRDPSDREIDQAVLHTDNTTPFKEIVAVLDAISTPRREVKRPDGASREVAAFNMVFSSR